MKVAIAGVGYVGLVTGVCLAELGHNVVCVDSDKDKIDKMKHGISPIYEKDLEQLMNKNAPRLTYTLDFYSAYKTADIIFIGVGTPEKSDGSANLSFVYTVVDQICESVEHESIVVMKSTVPIGTNNDVDKYFKENCNQDIKIHVVSNPEFLSQGTAVSDTLYPSRIVIGLKENNEYAKQKLKELYQNIDSPVLFMDRCSAEMVKYASNDFLALKISYINEIANLCDIIGANIDDVAQGMGYDSRIGNKFLKAGIGYGGSCFPKDTKALHWLANYHDYELKTVKAAIEVNERQKLILLKKAKKYYKSFKGLNVAVLGVTFKPETDDLREAPALVNIPVLLEDGANIRVWDPVARDSIKKIYGDKLKYSLSISEAIQNSDICFIFTEWEEIRNYNLDEVVKRMNRPLVLDGRNCWDIYKVKKAGIEYEAIGK